jgi:multidrug efflux pump subunit AcrA (membrane-fusion protein)
MKDFIVLAGIFFFLCLWAVRDAWFPTPKVLRDHPQRVEVSFPVDGTIKLFHVAVGDSIASPKDGHEPTLLASLNDLVLQEQFDKKKAEYVALEDGAPEKEALLEEVVALKNQLEHLTVHCPELGKEKGGTVSELLVSRYDKVKAGQPVLVIVPNKGFYLFNKSLAIISFIAFWVFLGIHFMTQ